MRPPNTTKPPARNLPMHGVGVAATDSAVARVTGRAFMPMARAARTMSASPASRASSASSRRNAAGSAGTR